jgi:hypothetical protein
LDCGRPLGRLSLWLPRLAGPFLAGASQRTDPADDHRQHAGERCALPRVHSPRALKVAGQCLFRTRNGRCFFGGGGNRDFYLCGMRHDLCESFPLEASETLRPLRALHRWSAGATTSGPTAIDRRANQRRVADSHRRPLFAKRWLGTQRPKRKRHRRREQNNWAEEPRIRSAQILDAQPASSKLLIRSLLMRYGRLTG